MNAKMARSQSLQAFSWLSGTFVLLAACHAEETELEAGTESSPGCMSPTGGDVPLLPVPGELPEVDVQAGACTKLDPVVSINERTCVNYLRAVDCCYEPNPWADQSGEGGALTSCLNSVLPAPEGCEANLTLLSCAADLAESSCERFHAWRTFITHGHVDVVQSFAPDCDVPADLPCRDETVAVASACAYGFY